MQTVKVDKLTRYYDVYKKDPGALGSIKSFFNRKYEKVKAVNDISFSIEEGELIGFIGPNGAGKTTTLKCLSGLLYPTSGQVSVLGFEPFKRDYRFLREIALVMGQKNQLWWDLPPMETFVLVKEIYGISDKDFKKNLDELVLLLDASDFLKIPVKKLSLGQRMKCELIAALIHKPKVLFLDEPTIGLDVVMQKNVRGFIKEYNRRYNATIILTSHYMGDVQALCKRIIIINHGQILYDGLLANLVKKHAPFKVIKVILKEKVEKEKLAKFGDLKEINYPEVIFRVEVGKVGESAAKIIETLPIEDLYIEDPQIEDVIRKIFATAK